jgi:hypothetical protein
MMFWRRAVIVAGAAFYPCVASVPEIETESTKGFLLSIDTAAMRAEATGK